MFEVTAVANGYYGGKVRIPGEVFGILRVEDFSIEWMDTEESKVLSFVKEQAKLKGKFETLMDPQERVRQNAVSDRGRRHKDWLEAHNVHVDGDDAPDTRRVNTGGTDGIVGAEVPKPGQKLPAKERIALAETASGRTGLKAAEADEILAALEASTGSDNDDRSRDQAIDQSANAPTPDPLDHDGDGKKGGAKPATDADI